MSSLDMDRTLKFDSDSLGTIHLRRRQFFSTLRQQIWQIFDISPPKRCWRLKWMVPHSNPTRRSNILIFLVVHSHRTIFYTDSIFLGMEKNYSGGKQFSRYWCSKSIQHYLCHGITKMLCGQHRTNFPDDWPNPVKCTRALKVLKHWINWLYHLNDRCKNAIKNLLQNSNQP